MRLRAVAVQVRWDGVTHRREGNDPGRRAMYLGGLNRPCFFLKCHQKAAPARLSQTHPSSLFQRRSVMKSIQRCAGIREKTSAPQVTRHRFEFRKSQPARASTG